MRTYFLAIFVAMFLNITGASAQTGYIIKVDGDKVYMNLPNAKVSDVVSLLDNGGAMTDPRTGRTIQTNPEVVGQIKIIAVQGKYSVGRIYGNPTNYPQEGMTVLKGTVLQKNNYGETVVMIAPAEVNFPQGLNTMVGNGYGSEGYIGDYVSAILMQHLLKSDKIQLVDRSVLATQQNEISMGQSGAIDPNTALEYGRISGARYLVKITMLKPDVVNVSNSIPVKGISNFISDITKTRRSSATQYLPDNLSTAKIKVSVTIVTQVMDLQTGKTLFMSQGEGNASGKPQIGLEMLEYGNISLNSKDVDFIQTVTGKAIDNAFEKIGMELNEYFRKNL